MLHKQISRSNVNIHAVTLTLSVENIPVVMWPLGDREAMFLTEKLIDRQDFNRNLFKHSSFLQFLLLINWLVNCFYLIHLY